ncbi:hypothetical protein Nepgr_006494 [Nepenthes gracilis]|uniref:Uncharacterized protein n=1 Tax=Nepenthes gracilis TaxID=150966 RepID=A0AAD3S544_NEPGR|nr:hypothetical protein Nepgr_006494 [Nepenthes gracilis]
MSFLKNAMKRKHSFIQFFATTGILLLSVRSLGQKYRIHDLQEDIFSLKEEHQSLSDRMMHIKSSLLHESSLDTTGLFASRLRILFGDDEGPSVVADSYFFIWHWHLILAQIYGVGVRLAAPITFPGNVHWVLGSILPPQNRTSNGLAIKVDTLCRCHRFPEIEDDHKGINMICFIYGSYGHGNTWLYLVREFTILGSVAIQFTLTS